MTKTNLENKMLELNALIALFKSKRYDIPAFLGLAQDLSVPHHEKSGWFFWKKEIRTYVGLPRYWKHYVIQQDCVIPKSLINMFSNAQIMTYALKHSEFFIPCYEHYISANFAKQFYTLAGVLGLPVDNVINKHYQRGLTLQAAIRN